MLFKPLDCLLVLKRVSASGVDLRDTGHIPNDHAGHAPERVSAAHVTLHVSEAFLHPCSLGPPGIRLVPLLQRLQRLPVDHVMDVFLARHPVRDDKLEVLGRPAKIQERLEAYVLLQVIIQTVIVLEAFNVIALELIDQIHVLVVLLIESVGGLCPLAEVLVLFRLFFEKGTLRIQDGLIAVDLLRLNGGCFAASTGRLASLIVALLRWRRHFHLEQLLEVDLAGIALVFAVQQALHEVAEEWVAWWTVLLAL